MVRRLKSDSYRITIQIFLTSLPFRILAPRMARGSRDSRRLSQKSLSLFHHIPRLDQSDRTHVSFLSRDGRNSLLRAARTKRSARRIASYTVQARTGAQTRTSWNFAKCNNGGICGKTTFKGAVIEFIAISDSAVCNCQGRW
jgi:hypothetical protein